MRNKRLRRALLAVPPLLLLATAWWPFSKVRVGRDTTFVTTPLAEDGLPNFSLAILDKYRSGVTAENNAARPFWQAMGPRDLSPEEFAAICKDLGLEPPLPGPFLTSVTDTATADRVEKWIAAQHGEDEQNRETAEALLRAPFDDASFKTRPWTAEQLPPLAAWLAENEGPLDLLVEASRRPRFFSPPHNVLLDPRTRVIDMKLAHAEVARDAVRSLLTRAMQRLGAGLHDQAWQDVLACWRLGELIGAGPTLVETLVGVATRGAAAEGTLAILDSPTLPAETARTILLDLQSLESSLPLTDSVDFVERLGLLDVGLRVATGRLGGVQNAGDFKFKKVTFLDGNRLLKTTNSFFDRATAALAIEDWQARDDQLDLLFNDLSGATQKTWVLAALAMTGTGNRAELIADQFLKITAPALRAYVAAHQRDEANMTLVRVAAALAVYRTEHGDYPAALDDLTRTGVLSKLPDDPFTAAPFQYERRGNGYLLYSLYENRRDDGGLDVSRPIVAGEWVAEETGASPSASDLAIRLPLPPLKLPLDLKPADE
jgi:hypothetical protein